MMVDVLRAYLISHSYTEYQVNHKGRWLKKLLYMGISFYLDEATQVKYLKTNMLTPGKRNFTRATMLDENCLHLVIQENEPNEVKLDLTFLKQFFYLFFQWSVPHKS